MLIMTVCTLLNLLNSIYPIFHNGTEFLGSLECESTAFWCSRNIFLSSIPSLNLFKFYLIQVEAPP